MTVHGVNAGICEFHHLPPSAFHRSSGHHLSALYMSCAPDTGHSVPKLTIDIPNQTHTMGCLLRPHLFAQGAPFAACIVTHPQETSLRIIVHASNPTECLEMAISSAEHMVEEMVRAVDACQHHIDALEPTAR